jgi:hypothetical protein
VGIERRERESSEMFHLSPSLSPSLSLSLYVLDLLDEGDSTSAVVTASLSSLRHAHTALTMPEVSPSLASFYLFDH